jgi:hypothetical protein
VPFEDITSDSCCKNDDCFLLLAKRTSMNTYDYFQPPPKKIGSSVANMTGNHLAAFKSFLDMYIHSSDQI